MPSPIVRRITRVLAFTGIAVLTLVVTIVALLQVPAVATWVARLALGSVPLSPGYAIEVGRVSGNWFTGLRLENVRLRRGSRELALIESVAASYDPLQLRGPDRRLKALVVDGGRVAARRERDGWDLANALEPSTDTNSAGGDFSIDRLTVRRIEVAAQLAPDSTALIRGLVLEGRELVVGDPVLLTMDSLRAALAPPGGPPLWFDLAAAGAATAEEIRLDTLRLTSHRSAIAGRLTLPRSFDDPRIAERLDLKLQALPLALADLASVYPGVPPEGDLRLDANASADGRLVTARLAGRIDKGLIELEAATVVGQGAPAVYRMHGKVRDLDPSRLHRSAPIGVLNGEIDADLRGETLPLADGKASLRLRGSRVADTELRDLTLGAEVKRGKADLELRGELYGGTVRADGWARPFDSVPSYHLTGAAAGLDGTRPAAQALAGEAGDPTLDIRFSVEGDGVVPDEAALNGRVDLAAVRSTRERVPLGHATVAMDSGRVELRPDLLIAGGKVRGLVTANLGDTISYDVRQGTIDRVDLGRLMGDTVAAPLSGRFTLRGTGTAPEEASVTARIELDELRYAARRVEQVVARARSARRPRGARRARCAPGRAPGHRRHRAPVRFGHHVRHPARHRGQRRRRHLDGQPAYAGPVTLAATGRGRWSEADKAVETRVTLAPSRLGTIGVTGGDIVARLAGDRLTYDADIHTDGGALALEGEGRPLDPVPTYLVRSGRADSLDLGVLLGRDSLRTSITSRFSGSLTGSGIDSLRAKLDLEMLPSRINDAELSGGRVALGLERGALEGTARLEGADAAINAKVTGTVAAAGSRLRSEGDLRLEHLARWTGNPRADGRLEGRFGLDAVADSTGLVSLGGTVTAAGGIGDVRLQQVYLALRPTTGAIDVDTLVFRSNVATLDGGGRVALRGGGGTDTLRVVGRSGDLTPLALLAGADSVAVDSTLLDLTVTGPAERRRVSGSADLYRLLYAGNLAERVQVRGSGVLDSAGPGALGGTLRIDGAAAGKVTIRQIDLAGRYDSVVALRGTITVTDDVRLALGLDGTIAGDTTRAVLRRLDLTEGGRTWRLNRPAAIAAQPGVVRVNAFQLASGDRHIAVNGIFDRRDSSDMTLRFDGLDLDALADARLVPVAGRLDGNLRLSGPATAPSVEGKINLAVRRGGGEDVGRLTSELAWTRTGLRIDAEAAPKVGAGLRIQGTLPWRLTLVPPDTADAVGFAREPADTMALTVRADSFDLAFFEPFLPEESAQDLTGALAVDARIGGSPDRARASGTVDLRDLGVELPSLGITYSDGRLKGRLAGERFEIDTLRLLTGKKEELLARGSVLLKPLADPTLDITARLTDFRAINSDALHAVTTGELVLKGTAAEPVLTGRMELERAEIIVGTGGAAAVEEVTLTPGDLTTLAQRFGPAAVTGEAEGPSFVDRFRMNIDVRFTRRVWFRKTASPSIDIELAGRINIRQQPMQPMQFFGQVEPIPGRGEMNMYGRTFTLQDGTIALQGPVEATTLDVTAQYLVPTQGDPDDEEVLINVAAKGRPDSLSLDFTSEPSMGQEDILSYIVTGRPASDNTLVGGEGGGGGVNASQLAINQLAENIGGAAGEGLGFDVFQIRQEPSRGLTLTAGRYLSSRVFVSLQQPLRIGSTAEQQVGNATGPGFELEYTLSRWLRSTLRGGSLPAGLLMRGRYAF